MPKTCLRALACGASRGGTFRPSRHGVPQTCVPSVRMHDNIYYAFVKLTDMWLTTQMENFIGLYGGLLAGLSGFLTAIGAVLYARARVTLVERATKDLDWHQVSELSLDVAKLKKAAQKWQNNANAQEKVTNKELFEQAMLNRALQAQEPQPNVKYLEA